MLWQCQSWFSTGVAETVGSKSFKIIYLATAAAGTSPEWCGHPAVGRWWPQSPACGSLCSQQVHLLFSHTLLPLSHLVYIFNFMVERHTDSISVKCIKTVFSFSTVYSLISPLSWNSNLSPYLSHRLVSRLFFDCDQGQVDPVVAIARDQSSVYLQLLMHETQPPSQFTVSTITRYRHTLLMLHPICSVAFFC